MWGQYLEAIPCCFFPFKSFPFHQLQRYMNYAADRTLNKFRRTDWCDLYSPRMGSFTDPPTHAFRFTGIKRPNEIILSIYSINLQLENSKIKSFTNSAGGKFLDVLTKGE
jgi:hypothetical protein